MLKLLLSISTVLLMSLFTSCSTDEINENEDLLGVWKFTTVNENSTDNFILVFGDNNKGILILDNEFKSGEIISSAIPFSWKINDRMVTLLDVETSQNTYIINELSELVSSNSIDFRLMKVSNDYSKFY